MDSGRAIKVGPASPAPRETPSRTSCSGRLLQPIFAGPLTEIVTYSRDWEFLRAGYLQDPQAHAELRLALHVPGALKVRDDRVSFLDLKTSRMALPQDSSTVSTPPLAVASLNERLSV